MKLNCRFLWALLFALNCGCSGGKGSTSKRSSGGDGGDESVVETAGTAGEQNSPTDGGGEVDSSEFQPGQDPVPISGINLTYDNARSHCDYTETLPGKFDIICQATALLADGTEVIPAAIAPNVEITWQAVKELAGQLVSSDCTGGKDGLTYKCSVRTSANGVVNKLQFDLKVQDTKNALQKTESSLIMLPFSVGVAAGFVPMIPFIYRGYNGIDDAVAAEKPAEKFKRGFELIDYSVADLEILGLGSLCFVGETAYVAMGSYIVTIKKGKMNVFAGSNNPENLKKLDHRFRVTMAPYSIECLDDGILVSDQYNQRILKIKEVGPVEIIAGLTGTAATAPAADGALANQSALLYPRGVRKGPDGAIYFIDGNNFMLRKINSNGTLATVAGTGALGNTGDNGQAKLAKFGSLTDFVFGPDGSIYLVDVSYHVIRKIGPDGVISTFAGSGLPRFTTNDPNDLAEPGRIAIDKNGNIYVTEYYRGVKKITPDGTVTQFLGGAEIPRLAAPILINQDVANISLLIGKFPYQALAIGPDGYLYADSGPGIDKFDLVTGNSVGIFVGKNQTDLGCNVPVDAGRARFFEPSAMSFDQNGRLNVLDWRALQSENMLIKQIYRDTDGLGKVVKTIGCTDADELKGTNPSGYLPYINSLGTITTAPDGSIFLVNMSKHKIFKVSPAGVITLVAGTGTVGSTGDGGAAVSADLNQPIGITRAPDGSLFFVEYGSGKIRKIALDGIITTIVNVAGGAGDEGEGGLAINAKIRANTLAMGPDGNLYIADFGNGKIKTVDLSTGIITTIGGTGVPGTPGLETEALLANISRPSSIAVTNSGSVIFTDFYNFGVLELTKKIVGTGYTIAKITDLKESDSDCGTGRYEGAVEGSKVDDAIKTSLAVICKALVRAVAVQDTCPAVGGSTKIAFSQNFNEFGNIIVIERPCAQ